MTEVKVPNMIWTLAIVLGIALLHDNATRIETLTDGWISVWYIDLLIIAVIGYLKNKFPGTAALEQALAIIDLLRQPRVVTVPVSASADSNTGVQMRGPSNRLSEPATTETLLVEPPPIPAVPPPPNRALTWLAG